MRTKSRGATTDSANKFFGRIKNPQRFDSSRERRSLSGTKPPKSQSDFRGRSKNQQGVIERNHSFSSFRNGTQGE